MRPTVSLQNLFELRKTRSLSGVRESVGRAFEHLGRLGLSDASGALWPVILQVSPLAVPAVQSGDVLHFSGGFFRPDGSRSTKYQDAGYVLRVEAVHSVVRSSSAWETSKIYAPLPTSTECDAALGAFDDTSGTLFFRGRTHARSALLHRGAQALEQVRAYFSERGFLHVDAPVLVASGGMETYLTAFHTTYTDHRGHAHALELPTSPEFALKRMLVEGHPKVFSLAKAFRNQGELSAWHEPEFLMLEWYRSGAPIDELIRETRALVTFLAAALGADGFDELHWPIFSVAELFQEYAGLDLLALQDPRAFAEAASAKSPSVRLGDAWNDTFCKVFLDVIEPEIARYPACFVTEYPQQQAVLAADVPGKPFVKRFEAYLGGIEICNGFEELTDTAAMDRLFSTVLGARPELRRDAVFESAMRYGLPPCSGNALGIERVIAILLGLKGIRPLVPLPILSRAPEGEIAPE